MKIIDAHHHLWDLQACHYPWLEARGVRRFFGDPTPIQKNYLLGDFFDDIAELPIIGSVHVQVGVQDSQAVEETRWLQGLADVPDSKGFPQAIIAFADLSAADAPAQLDAHKACANVRGVRQIIGRSAKEDKHGSGHRLLDDPRWLANLKQLAAYNLRFDLQLIPAYLPAAYAALRTVPYTRIALCHCGSPVVQDKQAFNGWRAGLAQLGQLPNVFCKLSGFGMFDPHWTMNSIRPIIEVAIETFTPQRCMFGSNFPVDKLYTDYQRLWQAYFDLSSALSDDERQALLFNTANDFYALGL